MALCMLVLLCAGGYTLYVVLSAPSAPTVVSSSKDAPTPPRRAPAKPTASPAKNGAAPAKPSSPPSRPSASPVQSVSPSDRPVAPPDQPPFYPASPDSTDVVSTADGAVRRALRELPLLPYEEAYEYKLEETIGQIDNALLQVLRRLSLPPGSLRTIAVVELTSPQKEVYTFRRLDIFCNDRAETFERELEQSLRSWVEGAVVRRVDAGTLEILVKGVRTHLLMLRPTKPPLPSEADVGPAGRHRLRRPDEEPKLTIVIDDLGANMGAVRRLLALDYPVTFAFWPHAAHTREGAEAAHLAGREILVHLPMEPEGYPSVKPGPGVLLRDASPEQIRDLTARGIARVPYAVGLNNHMGSRFTRSREGVRVVLEELSKRNMFMLDSLTHPRSVFYAEGLSVGVPAYCRDVFLDHVISRQAVLAALRRAEATALLTGRAVAIGHPHPQTLDVLKEWELLRNPAIRIVRLQDLPR